MFQGTENPRPDSGRGFWLLTRRRGVLFLDEDGTLRKRYVPDAPHAECTRVSSNGEALVWPARAHVASKLRWIGTKLGEESTWSAPRGTSSRITSIRIVRGSSSGASAVLGFGDGWAAAVDVQDGAAISMARVSEHPIRSIIASEYKPYG